MKDKMHISFNANNTSKHFQACKTGGESQAERSHSSRLDQSKRNTTPCALAHAIISA